MKLVAGDDAAVAKWMTQFVGTSVPQPPYTALGWVSDGGEPIGGVLFNNYTRGANINVSVVWRGRLNRSVLHHVGAYVFGQLGCRRMTITTRASRANVIDQAKRIGFTLEGRHPQYFPDDDGVTLGILKQDWRW